MRNGIGFLESVFSSFIHLDAGWQSKYHLLATQVTLDNLVINCSADLTIFPQKADDAFLHFRRLNKTVNTACIMNYIFGNKKLIHHSGVVAEPDLLVELAGQFGTDLLFWRGWYFWCGLLFGSCGENWRCWQQG